MTASHEEARFTLPRRNMLATGGSAALAMLGGCARGTETRAAPAGVVSLNNDNATWAPGNADASGRGRGSRPCGSG